MEVIQCLMVGIICHRTLEVTGEHPVRGWINGGDSMFDGWYYLSQNTRVDRRTPSQRMDQWR